MTTRDPDRPVVEAAKTTVSIIVLAPVAIIAIIVALAIVGYIGSSPWLVGGLIVFGICAYGKHIEDKRPLADKEATRKRAGLQSLAPRLAAKRQQDERIEAIIATTDPHPPVISYAGC